MSWAPLDDPNFALDPNDALYNEAVDAPVMQVVDSAEVVGQQKKERSKVAVGLHQASTVSFVKLIPHITEATPRRLEGATSSYLFGRSDTWCRSWRFSNRSSVC